MPSSYGVLDLAQLSAPIVPLHRLSLLPRSEIGDSFVPKIAELGDGQTECSVCQRARWNVVVEEGVDVEWTMTNGMLWTKGVTSHISHPCIIVRIDSLPFNNSINIIPKFT
jgi:hypothetical protein